MGAMPARSAPPPKVVSLLAQPDLPSGYEQVVGYLTTQLTSGALKVGDRLLPERELAARLNVSRPVLREALRSLAMIGVLEIRQGAGAFVRAPDASNLARVLTFMMAQQADLVDDIMEVRIALERQAIRLACERARGPDLARLAAAFDRIVATIDDPVEGGRADYAFHTSLVDASHSPALVQVYGVASALLETSHIARRQRIAQAPEHRAFLVDHHEQILRAIQARDADKAERLLTSHFRIGAELAQSRHG
jgi:GntR family transcriptional repressor for pyruvate dehydrogenase complex